MNQIFRTDRISQHVVPIDPCRMTVSYLARRLKEFEDARIEADRLLHKMRTTIGSEKIYRAMAQEDAIQILISRIDSAVQIVKHEPGLPLRENSVLDALRSVYPRALSYAAISESAFGGHATPRSLSTIVKNLNAIGWSIDCVHNFGYQMKSLERGNARIQAKPSLQIKDLAAPLPAGFTGCDPRNPATWTPQNLIGFLNDGLGVSCKISNLSLNEKITFLCFIYDYLTCETGLEDGHGKTVSRAVRALRLAYPMPVSGDAIVGLLYDDAGSNFCPTRLNVNATMKRMRDSGYRIGTLIKRGFCLLDYDRLPERQSALLVK
jgi:biotin operon repressor